MAFDAFILTAVLRCIAERTSEKVLLYLPSGAIDLKDKSFAMIGIKLLNTERCFRIVALILFCVP